MRNKTKTLKICSELIKSCVQISRGFTQKGIKLWFVLNSIFHNFFVKIG